MQRSPHRTFPSIQRDVDFPRGERGRTRVGHLLPGGDDSPTLTRQLPTAGDAKLLAISFDARQREKVHSRAPLCTGWLHSAHVPGVYLGEEGLTYWDRSGRLAAFMYSRLVLVLGASNDIVSSSFSATLFLKRHLHATSRHARSESNPKAAIAIIPIWNVWMTNNRELTRAFAQTRAKQQNNLNSFLSSCNFYRSAVWVSSCVSVARICWWYVEINSKIP